MIELNDALSWLLRRWRSFTERLYIRQAASVAHMPIDIAYQRVLLWSSLPKRAGVRDEMVRKALSYSSSSPQLRAMLMNVLAGLLDERRDFGRKHVDRQLLNHIPGIINRESVSIEIYGYQKRLLGSILSGHDQPLLDSGMTSSFTIHPELAAYVAYQLKRELQARPSDHIETVILQELLEEFETIGARA